jgi:hypothetical protein
MHLTKRMNTLLGLYDQCNRCEHKNGLLATCFEEKKRREEKKKGAVDKWLE